MISLRGLDPRIRAAAEYAIQVAEFNGIPVTVTSARRSSSEQSRLRAQYEGCLARGERVYPGNPDARCHYPANRPGLSAHEYGLAFDSVVPEEDWPVWNDIRRWVGFGLDPNDRVHAELPGISQLLRSQGT